MKEETNETNGSVIMKEHRARGTALIPVEHLRIKPGFNYRVDFDPLLMELLKKSIIQRGVERNLKVQPSTTDNCYYVRDGERRLRCVWAINQENPGFFKTLKCDIIDESINDEEALASALVGNQGIPPNKLEMAYVVKRFRDYNWETSTIAETFGITKEKVEKLYQFWNSIPTYIKEQWLKQEINYKEAMKLIKETPKNIEKKNQAKAAKKAWNDRVLEFVDAIPDTLKEGFSKEDFDDVINEIIKQHTPKAKKVKETTETSQEDEPITEEEEKMIENTNEDISFDDVNDEINQEI